MRREGRGKVPRTRSPFLIFQKRLGRELQRVGLGDRDIGGAGADLRGAVIEYPFHRPDQSSSSNTLILAPHTCPWDKI